MSEENCQAIAANRLQAINEALLAGILILGLTSYIERDLYKQVDLVQELGVDLEALTTAGVFVVISGLFGSLCAFGGSQHKEVLLIFIGISIGSLIVVDMTTLDLYFGKLYNLCTEPADKLVYASRMYRIHNMAFLLALIVKYKPAFAR